MIVVIIAGGSGTRLWPLSTPDYPKHLLKIAGDERSLLQHTYDRARSLTDKIYVVSEAGHIEHVKQQLAELPADHFIVEPGRRGTANCILAALVRVGQRHDHSEPLVAVHADHYIRDTAGFGHTFRIATDMSAQEQRMVLVGVEPSYPATGFGYIEKGPLLNDEAYVYNVASFKEKPDHHTAVAYLASGNYLWNCGYFAGSLDVFEASMQTYATDLFANYQKLAAASEADFADVYLGLEDMAIDYALIEKMDNLLVAPAAFDWMDVGSFADLHQAVTLDTAGNHIQGNVQTDEVANSLIQNNDDRPLAVIGLDNVVVINTPNGILVTRKDLSQKVGPISKRFNQQ